VNISTDVTEARYEQIRRLHLLHNTQASRILYYLAGEADRLEKSAAEHPDYPELYQAYADIAGDLFEDACRAAREGWLV